MYEIESFADEVVTGWTDDPSNYGYTYHNHTKDLVKNMFKIFCTIN